MVCLRKILQLLIVMVSINLYSQTNIKIAPKSNATVFVEKSKVFFLNTSRDRQKLSKNSIEELNQPYKLSDCDSYNIPVNADSLMVFSDSSSKTYLLEIQSKNALGISFVFNPFYLDSGAYMHLYTPDKKRIIGAYTANNNHELKILATEILPGEKIFIEITTLSNDASTKVYLNQACSAFRNVFNIEGKQKSNTTSSPGINCEEGKDWQVEKHSVCRYTYISGKSQYLCTGALINNARNDQTPYFLTANHCVSKEEEAQTAVFYFNYEESVCDQTALATYKTLSGSALMATSTGSDFTLLKLNKVPTSEYSPYYAGWNVKNIAAKSGVGIHHPKGEPKQISTSDKAAKNIRFKIVWSETITTDANTHWQVDFTNGDTQTGSSGSPYFDQDKRIVGQLHGGPEDDSSIGYYGKLSYSYNSSTDKTKHLKTWLNPDNENISTLDGLFPMTMPTAIFETDFTTVCIDAPVVFKDKSTHQPTSRKWTITPKTYKYVNGFSDTSKQTQVIFTNEGNYTIKLFVKNSIGSDSMVMTDLVFAGKSLKPAWSMNIDENICKNDLPLTYFKAKGGDSISYSLDQNSMYFDSQTSVDGYNIGLKNNLEDSFFISTNIIANISHGNCQSTIVQPIKVIDLKNDNFINAYPIQLGDNGPYTNFCATVELNEAKPLTEDCKYNQGWCGEGELNTTMVDNSVWFKFTAPPQGEVTLALTGFDSQVALYELKDSKYPSVENLKLIAANDNYISENPELKNIMVEPGKEYYIQVDGSNGGEKGYFNIQLYWKGFDIISNPNSNGLLQIKINEPLAKKIKIELIDNSGILLLTENITVQGYETINLNTQGFLPGIYQMRLKMDNNTYLKKVLIY